MNWYLARGEEQQGPLSLDELKRELGKTDERSALVWRDGFDGWKPPNEVEELTFRGATPPPLPFAKSADRIEAPVPPLAKSQSLGIGKKIFHWITIAASAVFGMTMARTMGSTFWIPAILVAGVWAASLKFKVARECLIPLLAFLVGQTAWMLVGHSILLNVRGFTEDTLLFFVDLVLVAAIAIWMIRKPSTMPVWCALLYEVAALGFGLILFDESAAPGPAKVMHIVLRLAGIVSAIYALVMLRKGGKTAVSVEPHSEAPRAV